MLQLKRVLSVTAFCATTGMMAFAQTVPDVKLPTSPPGQAAVQFGGRWEADGNEQRYRDGKWVVVDYGRPLLRGRKDIFGSGAEYGKTVNGDAAIWRAGANATTRLTTQLPLVIGGTTIQPGVYNVFVDLKPGNWTLVLNTQPIQETYDPKDKVKLFGAYNYDAKADVLRAPMTVRSNDMTVEQFTIGFVNATENSATLTMWWDKTMATVAVGAAASKPDSR